MIKIYVKKSPEEELSVHPKPIEGCWIHIDEATSNDLATLSKWTNIDPVDLQDCLDKYEIPRIEKIRDYLLIFTRYPTDQEVGLYTSTLTLIISSNYFITISPHRCDLIKTFLEQNKSFSTPEHNPLLAQLLFKVNQEFTAQIRKVRYNVLSAEKEMARIESEDITILTKNEEVLNQYLSSLMPFRNILEALNMGRYANFSGRDTELVGDLLNSVKQSEELCSIVLKSIRSLREAYQTIFANNLQKTIKLLTALTIILNIPTMIASIYGMNIDLPLAKSSVAFSVVMSLTIISSIIALVIFKRKRWL